jgi:hypothetical protein
VVNPVCCHCVYTPGMFTLYSVRSDHSWCIHSFTSRILVCHEHCFVGAMCCEFFCIQVFFVKKIDSILIAVSFSLKMKTAYNVVDICV